MIRFLKWAVVIFVVWYLIKNPTSAAHVIDNGVVVLGRAVGSLGRFVNGIHT